MGTNANPNTRNRNMPRSLDRRRAPPHINMWMELKKTEQQIESMEKLLAQHNPGGHGFDSSFGHKGGTSGGMSGFIRPKLSLFVGDMREQIEDDSGWRMFQSGQSETQFICYQPTETGGLTATDLNRVGVESYMEPATEFSSW